MKDKEFKFRVNQREDRIMVNQPDPKSNYYVSENERFGSLEYAKQEKMQRESKQSALKMVHEMKRAKNFEKSFQRWEHSL